MKARIFVARFFISIVMLALASSACKPASANPEAVVQDLGKALNAGDLEAAVALIADDAVFQMDFFEETLHGVDEFRSLFEGLIAGHFRIELTTQAVDGGTVTTETKTWGDGVPGDGPNIATEEYVITDGKISSITWTPTEETVAKLMEAMSAMESEAIVQSLGKALNAGDLEAAVALIAADAVFQMDFFEETLHGVDEFRSLFEGLIAGHFRIELTTQAVDGGTVTTETKTWGDGVPGDGPNIAIEEYVITDGKISSITWTPTEETVAKLTAAMSAMSIEQAITGAWVTNEGDSHNRRYHVYTEDGKYCYGSYLPALLKDESDSCKDYELEGNTLSEICAEESLGCTVGDTCKVEVEILEDGRLSYFMLAACPGYPEGHPVIGAYNYFSRVEEP